MAAQNLFDILQKKQATLELLERTTTNATREQLQRRPHDGAWSVEQILEHLSIVETQLLRLTTMLLAKAEERPPTGPSQFVVSIDHLRARAAREKYVTRDNFEPTGKVSTAAALESLRTIQAELFKLRPRLECIDPSGASFPHWVFGPLTIGEWIAFWGAHEERHLAQIAALLRQTPELGSSTT